MTGVAILGAGAFGTALALALAQKAPVTLWARDPGHAREMADTRENRRRLPGLALPPEITVEPDLKAALATAQVVLLAIPMQALGRFAAAHADQLGTKALVSCCKGLDLGSRRGPAGILAAACPRATVAVLTGPSFAADIARGLPTALTLACADDLAGVRLQRRLAGPTLRLYRTGDVIGAELGGALKNVVAIGAGIVCGAGLGESARAALITRGHAEMQRLAMRLGARAETLAGLSGLGDLVLTATSERSRNYAFGQALARDYGRTFDRGITVEGVATARAVVDLAGKLGIAVPVSETVAMVCAGDLTIAEAIDRVFNRPLKEE